MECKKLIKKQIFKIILKKQENDRLLPVPSDAAAAAAAAGAAFKGLKISDKT